MWWNPLTTGGPATSAVYRLYKTMYDNASKIALNNTCRKWFKYKWLAFCLSCVIWCLYVPGGGLQPFRWILLSGYLLPKRETIKPCIQKANIARKKIINSFVTFVTSRKHVIFHCKMLIFARTAVTKSGSTGLFIFVQCFIGITCVLRVDMTTWSVTKYSAFAFVLFGQFTIQLRQFSSLYCNPRFIMRTSDAWWLKSTYHC